MLLIAADTSSVVAYLSGETGDDVARIDLAMGDSTLRLPPPFMSEFI